MADEAVHLGIVIIPDLLELGAVVVLHVDLLLRVRCLRALSSERVEASILVRSDTTVCRSSICPDVVLLLLLEMIDEGEARGELLLERFDTLGGGSFGQPEFVDVVGLTVSSAEGLQVSPDGLVDFFQLDVLGQHVVDVGGFVFGLLGRMGTTDGQWVRLFARGRLCAETIAIRCRRRSRTRCLGRRCCCG